MGLAPYGEPKYVDLIENNLIDIHEDGSFWLDQSYFDYCTGLTMTNDKFADLFGEPARPAEGELTQFHMDVAASIQQVTENIVLKITSSLAEEYNCKNLCLAGGVALNCVANGKIESQGAFDNIWVQPAQRRCRRFPGRSADNLSPPPRSTTHRRSDSSGCDARQLPRPGVR